jgi:hypothetical protein
MNRNQRGFGTIEIILIVVGVAIIAGTGFYVWHAKQMSDKNIAIASSSAVQFKSNSVTNYAECQKATGSKILQTSPEQCVTKSGKTYTDNSQPPVQQYLVIKEWGVRLKLNASTQDAYYEFPGGPTYAFLSTKSLAAVAPDCAPGKVSLGLIFRQTTTEYQDALADQQANGKNIDNVTGDIHIGDYYYGYSSPQAGCTDNNAPATTLYNTARPALINAVKTLEAIPDN